MRAIDLHTHTTYSDGTFSVQELIDRAHEKGLAAIALTDHDTVDGVDEAIEYAALKYPDLEVIPGVELSTEAEGREVHIVGLYIDNHDEEFVSGLKDFVDSRTDRNIKMCKKLSEEAGIPVSYEALIEEFPDTVITRAHFAKYMVDKGYVNSRNEVFERYIGDHCPYYVDREKITPEDAIGRILKVKGVPIFAHPILCRFSDDRLDHFVGKLKGAGLVGIEAIYSTYERRDEIQIKNLAKKYDLLISGGSDFHGANKPDIDLATGYGRLFIPEDLLIPIKAARG